MEREIVLAILISLVLIVPAYVWADEPAWVRSGDDVVVRHSSGYLRCLTFSQWEDQDNCPSGSATNTLQIPASCPVAGSSNTRLSGSRPDTWPSTGSFRVRVSIGTDSNHQDGFHSSANFRDSPCYTLSGSVEEDEEEEEEGLPIPGFAAGWRYVSPQSLTVGVSATWKIIGPSGTTLASSHHSSGLYGWADAAKCSTTDPGGRVPEESSEWGSCTGGDVNEHCVSFTPIASQEGYYFKPKFEGNGVNFGTSWPCVGPVAPRGTSGGGGPGGGGLTKSEFEDVLGQPDAGDITSSNSILSQITNFACGQSGSLDEQRLSEIELDCIFVCQGEDPENLVCEDKCTPIIPELLEPIIVPFPEPSPETLPPEGYPIFWNGMYCKEHPKKEGQPKKKACIDASGQHFVGALVTGIKQIAVLVKQLVVALSDLRESLKAACERIRQTTLMGVIRDVTACTGVPTLLDLRSAVTSEDLQGALRIAAGSRDGACVRETIEQVSGDVLTAAEAEIKAAEHLSEVVYGDDVSAADSDQVISSSEVENDSEGTEGWEYGEGDVEGSMEHTWSLTGSCSDSSHDSKLSCENAGETWTDSVFVPPSRMAEAPDGEVIASCVADLGDVPNLGRDDLSNWQAALTEVELQWRYELERSDMGRFLCGLVIVPELADPDADRCLVSQAFTFGSGFGGEHAGLAIGADICFTGEDAPVWMPSLIVVVRGFMLILAGLGIWQMYLPRGM